MKFYRGNRADEIPFDLLTEDIVRNFLASEWNGYPWPITRALNAFIASTIGSWADRDEFDALVSAVLDAREATERP